MSAHTAVAPGSERDCEPVPSAEFQITDRWRQTATDFSSARNQGDPITLTWGIVADGTPISSFGAEPEPSDLIASFDSVYGAGEGGLQQAPWFRLFAESFARWSQLSGVLYEFEPNDGGAAINQFTTPRGQRGVYPDVRIGGHPIGVSESGGNTLAYNYFPDHADMVLDTEDAPYFGNRQLDSRRLRNVLMHEAGHGLGLNHLVSSDSGQLMEPFISIAFDGPQIDDILAVQRNYGDPLERDGGNDSAGAATQIGSFQPHDSWVIGADGRAVVVAPDQTDFVSIDGLSDRDYFRFEVAEPTTVSVTLSQVGRSYLEGATEAEQLLLETAELNPLEVELIGGGYQGIASLRGRRPEGIDTVSIIAAAPLTPGVDYYVGVRGTIDNVQLYELSLEFGPAPVPEPQAALLILAGLAAAGARRVA
ncbi:matrixin family metalloprotease [Botrimarina sp.]|uniref:matrixin family metalloprotease n=1 Tax=Botrimarina sp. TaxID=2795802 RepID=UPI0032EE7D4F